MPLAAWSKTVKVDNSPAAEAAKIAIRNHVLSVVTPAAVFDGFAGSGVMHRNVWHKAAQYCGCDQRHFRDGRLAFVADNRRVLRAIVSARMSEKNRQRSVAMQGEQ